jgi:hypothetical protein
MERITGSTNIWCPGVLLLALVALFLIIFRRKPKKDDLPVGSEDITEETKIKPQNDAN